MNLNADEREALNRLRRHGEALVGKLLGRDIELLCRLVDRAEAREDIANQLCRLVDRAEAREDIANQLCRLADWSEAQEQQAAEKPVNSPDPHAAAAGSSDSAQ